MSILSWIVAGKGGARRDYTPGKKRSIRATKPKTPY